MQKLETEIHHLKTNRDEVLQAMEDDIRKLARENGALKEENVIVTRDIRNILAERDDILAMSRAKEDDFHEVCQVK